MKKLLFIIPLLVGAQVASAQYSMQTFTLPAPLSYGNGIGQTQFLGVSRHGTYVLIKGEDYYGNPHALLYNTSTASVLSTVVPADLNTGAGPTPTGGQYWTGTFAAVNDKGRCVATMTDPITGNLDVFLYDHVTHVLTPVTLPTGYTFASYYPFSINVHDNIAGTCIGADGHNRPFLWNQITTKVIFAGSELVGAALYGSASEIDDNNAVVGTYQSYVLGTYSQPHGFDYYAGFPHDVIPPLTSTGLPGSIYNGVGAVATNDSGNVLGVGSYITQQGEGIDTFIYTALSTSPSYLFMQVLQLNDQSDYPTISGWAIDNNNEVLADEYESGLGDSDIVLCDENGSPTLVKDLLPPSAPPYTASTYSFYTMDMYGSIYGSIAESFPNFVLFKLSPPNAGD